MFTLLTSKPQKHNNNNSHASKQPETTYSLRSSDLQKNENIKEIISNNVNGFLINDENELRKIVNKILKDEIDFENISKNAIEFVLNNNSLEKFIMDEFKEYQRLNSS